MTREQLLFAEHAKMQLWDALFDRAARLLGTKFDVDELVETGRKLAGAKTAKDYETVMIPLSLLVNPQALEMLKNSAQTTSLNNPNKKKRSKQGGFDLNTLPADVFRALMGKKGQELVSGLSDIPK